MRRARWFCLGLMAVMCWGGQAAATTPPSEPVDPAVPVETVPPSSVPPSTLPPAQGPLVVVPPGCVAPPPATAVFVGSITAVDVPAYTTARFRVTEVLAGNLRGYLANDLVDVHFGEETRFLAVGTRYIVGAHVDPVTGLLVSTVRQPSPLFGGDAVIGANDTDVDCPRVEDPVRTLHVDGTAVETGVLAPLDGEGSSLLRAVLEPMAVAFGVLLALVLLKQLLFAIGRALREMGDVVERPPKRPPRRHRTVSVNADQSSP